MSACMPVGIVAVVHDGFQGTIICHIDSLPHNKKLVDRLAMVVILAVLL